MISTESAARPPLLDTWRAAITSTELFATFLEYFHRSKRFEIPALPGSLGAVLLAAVAGEIPESKTVAILPDQEEAEEAAYDLAAMVGKDVVRLLPEWPFDPYEELSPSPLLSYERHDALLHLERSGRRIVVTSASALTIWSSDLSALRAREHQITEGEERRFDELVSTLLLLGYERNDLVEEPAKFAVRGGLIDISPPHLQQGVRLEFWGDTIEAIREFKLSDQKTVGGLGRVRIPPVREVAVDRHICRVAAERADVELEGGIVADTPLERALDRNQLWEGLEWYLPLLTERTATLADIIPKGTIVAVWEPERVNELINNIHLRAAENYSSLESPEGWLPPQKILTPAAVLKTIQESHSGVDFSLVASGEREVVRCEATRAPAVAGDFDLLREEIRRFRKEGIVPTILVEEDGQRDRLEDLLGSQEESGPRLILGQLEAGFVWKEADLAVWPDHELFRRSRRSHRLRARGRGAIRSYHSLTIGDLVVHVDHGIGRYEGLRSLSVDGLQTELLELAYAGEDKLLVPIDQMARVQKYIGQSEENSPSLNTLGSVAWQRTVERAKSDLLEMAEELVRLYAIRSTAGGTAHPLDDILLEELEASFPYTETPDQARAVQDVKKDLESARNMDRLICGDVGYGKTEVAIRASLKVIEGGAQVAVLVPTTVLAQQHLETFRERLDGFPVRIDMLSRFRTKAQQIKTLEDLASGQADLVIGTHRLLSGDVTFSNLGLIVIDEEHRFGVRAKEKLKSKRAQVDVLSLTATPIPRTLHMSLLGIRDISVITTPPEDRLPIHTEVMTFNEEIIEDAIRSELQRGGQVFFVHNRVQSIDSALRLVQRIVPEARVGLAHGQMREGMLEKAMIDFTSGATDVLVSTMIIESGLDMPNANTLIVNRADRLGLAQLYQLRGRVGRSSQKAFAYFLVPKGRRMTRDARQRLQAVQQHSELGAGLYLAMRDLEIRGAGNLLGAQQHGHIAAVGYDLYQEMLAEAVAEIQETPGSVWSPPRLELPGEAYLPEEYVSIPGLRLEFYRRAVEIRDIEEIGELYSELRDRFGPLPAAAAALIDATYIRVAGAELGLDSLVIQKDVVTGIFSADRVFDRPMWENLLERLGPGVRFAGDSPLTFEIKLEEAAPPKQIREVRNRLLKEKEARYVTALINEKPDRKEINDGK